MTSCSFFNCAKFGRFQPNTVTTASFDVTHAPALLENVFLAFIFVYYMRDFFSECGLLIKRLNNNSYSIFRKTFFEFPFKVRGLLNYCIYKLTETEV